MEARTWKPHRKLKLATKKKKKKKKTEHTFEGRAEHGWRGGSARNDNQPQMPTTNCLLHSFPIIRFNHPLCTVSTTLHMNAWHAFIGVAEHKSTLCREAWENRKVHTEREWDYETTQIELSSHRRHSGPRKRLSINCPSQSCQLQAGRISVLSFEVDRSPIQQNGATTWEQTDRRHADWLDRHHTDRRTRRLSRSLSEREPQRIILQSLPIMAVTDGRLAVR